MKVLVVESSRTQQHYFSKILESHGPEVDLASSGEEALIKIKANDYHLICISVILKDISGPELCSVIRKEVGDKMTPLIILSSGDSSDTEESLLAGATDIFFKNDIIAFRNYISSFFSSMHELQTIGGNILYVEDSKVIALVINRFLTKNGFSVVHFDNAEDAYDAYHEFDFDILICDIVLAGNMTGLQLVRKIRGVDKDKQLGILVMSGFDDRARTSEVYRAGANDYISKPPNYDELLSRMKNLLLSKHLFEQLQRRNSELVQLAMVDVLTGLYNRRFINEMAATKIEEARILKQSVAFAILDIDHFKLINDTHGHALGDEVLSKLGELLTQSSSDSCIPARYGGEEFLIVMPTQTQKEAISFCEKIRKNVENLHPAGIKITVSIGVSSLDATNSSMTFEDICSQADKALYHAKDNGRNQVSDGNELAISSMHNPCALVE